MYPLVVNAALKAAIQSMFKHGISAFVAALHSLYSCYPSRCSFSACLGEIGVSFAYVQVISKNFLAHFQRVTFSLKFFS